MPVSEHDYASLSNMDNDIMRRLQERFLVFAEREGRFVPQTSEYHRILNYPNARSRHDVTVESESEEKHFHPTTDSTALSSLHCIFQRKRPLHVRGQLDALPFKDADTVRRMFRNFRLPASYFQIADGSPATARSSVLRNDRGRPVGYELVAHCLTKRGNWAMALAHGTSNWSTSVFWSVDHRVDSQTLCDDLWDFQDYAGHPMLIPCIMYAAAFRMAVQRRHSVKDRLQKLESAIAHLSQPLVRSEVKPHDPDADDGDDGEEAPNLELLFGLLQSCREDQASRKGLYDFWNSYKDAVEEGFQYAGTVMSLPTDGHAIFLKAHADLHQWSSMTWQRFESLQARDKDHNSRVDNVSHLLHNLVQQRDMRLQSSIARASHRDSQDMKFIAVLGSIFLPASLIATILNVPQFQFAQGVTLFGAYIAITVPFIALVVLVCLTRPYWTKWRPVKKRRLETNDGRESAMGDYTETTMRTRLSRLTTIEKSSSKPF